MVVALADWSLDLEDFEVVSYLDCLDLLHCLFQRNWKSHCFQLEAGFVLGLFGWIAEAKADWMELFVEKEDLVVHC